MATRSAIDAFLAEPAFALLGASRSGRGFGSLALRELLRKGYRVLPVHPHADRIDDVPCARSLADLPERVGAAIVVLHPPETLKALDDLATRGIRRVWLQQGAESPAVLARAAELGLEVIAGECVLMYARPSGIHRLHAGARNLLDRVRRRAA